MEETVVFDGADSVQFREGSRHLLFVERIGERYQIPLIQAETLLQFLLAGGAGKQPFHADGSFGAQQVHQSGVRRLAEAEQQGSGIRVQGLVRHFCQNLGGRGRNGRIEVFHTRCRQQQRSRQHQH